MVTIGQVLIKIGTQYPAAANWSGDRDVQIPFPIFSAIMRNPGPFTLESKKTIAEKWVALTEYYDLVTYRAPTTGRPKVIGIRPERAKALIRDTIPKSVLRRNAADREEYLKTGVIR